MLGTIRRRAATCRFRRRAIQPPFGPRRQLAIHSQPLSGTTLPVEQVNGPFHQVPVDVFRTYAFELQRALLVSNDQSRSTAADDAALPAITKWFTPTDQTANADYLEPYAETLLPFELFTAETSTDCVGGQRRGMIADFRSWLSSQHPDLASYLTDELEQPAFHRFYAPLRLLLLASERSAERGNHLPGLYIAQAQISELPHALAADLPAPRAVMEAGRGSIYDANVWLGCPPTYTPLHKDPNPNMFVQLVGEKRVRLLPPADGLQLFIRVQRQIGQNASPNLRGDEMMFGPEREALHRAVWEELDTNVYEATVRPGDALVIPKGWWHSIKSIGSTINASVNWWFR